MVVVLKPKPMVNSEHTLQDTVSKDNTAERTKETLLIVKEQVREQIDVLKLKAPKLINELGSYQERVSGERGISLTMNSNSRPVVVLTGYWDGRLIQSAMNAIAKQYRQRRITATKM